MAIENEFPFIVSIPGMNPEKFNPLSLENFGQVNGYCLEEIQEIEQFYLSIGNGFTHRFRKVTRKTIDGRHSAPKFIQTFKIAMESENSSKCQEFEEIISEKTWEAMLGHKNIGRKIVKRRFVFIPNTSLIASETDCGNIPTPERIKFLCHVDNVAIDFFRNEFDGLVKVEVEMQDNPQTSYSTDNHPFFVNNAGNNRVVRANEDYPFDVLFPACIAKHLDVNRIINVAGVPDLSNAVMATGLLEPVKANIGYLWESAH